VAQQSYMAAIDRWEERVPEELLAIAQQGILNMIGAVVEDTPFDLGFLRGSWQPSVGGLPPPKASVTLDPGGGMALADASLEVANLTLGETFYYSNACVYARRLEYGFVGEDSLGRTYNQAGRFYVTMNAMRWPGFVAQAVAEVGS
jgi:hypothetical protein